METQSFFIDVSLYVSVPLYSFFSYSAGSSSFFARVERAFEIAF